MLIASHDSFINSGALVNKCLLDKVSGRELLVPVSSSNQVSISQLANCVRGYNVKYHTLTGCLEYISNRNNGVIVCCLGIGVRKKLLRAVNKDKHLNTRSILITCFSGIIFGDKRTLLSHSGADLVLLNSQADMREYQRLGKEFRFATDNAMVFGLPQLLGATKRTISVIKTVCFFEQVIAPATFAERSQLLRELVTYAECFPEREVLIKLRCRPGERSVHKQIWHLEILKRKLRLDFPGNLQFTYEPVPSLLDRIDFCLTISSTVALEALARNIPVGIINDFGIRADTHTIHFVNSGCIVSFADLRSGCIPVADEVWVKNQVKIPDPAALNRKVAQLLKQREGGCLPVRAVVDMPAGEKLNALGRFRKKLKKFFNEPLVFFCDSRFRVLSIPARWLFRIRLNRKMKSWSHFNNG